MNTLLAQSQTAQLQHTDLGKCLHIDNQHAKVIISLFGGHVLSYVNKNDNKERLWLSKKAIFDGKTPIRGGIPICWPWFAAHSHQADFPSHGYLRTQMWQLESINEGAQNSTINETQIVLVPTQTEQFSYQGLSVKLVVDIGEKLKISLVTINKSHQDIALSQALHTYLKIDNIHQTSIQGVDSPYDDKPTGQKQLSAPSPYCFSEQTDRIHYNKLVDDALNWCQFINILHAEKPLDILQSGQSSAECKVIRRVEHSGHDSTVIWNPWSALSANMQDMTNDGYVTMLCVEAANTQSASIPLILKPNQIHKLRQSIN